MASAMDKLRGKSRQIMDEHRDSRNQAIFAAIDTGDPNQVKEAVKQTNFDINAKYYGVYGNTPLVC